MELNYLFKNLLVSFTIFTLFTFLFAKPVLGQEEQAGSSATLATETKEQTEDHRGEVLKEFLQTYDSPLAKHAEAFVKSADSHNIDWRLLAAISGVESTFAHQLPQNSFNAWGWGIYGDNMIRFSSYEEAIETISKTLREKYVDQWRAKNPYEIGKYYAASPTWAEKVSYFMDKIHDFELKRSAKTLSVSL